MRVAPLVDLAGEPANHRVGLGADVGPTGFDLLEVVPTTGHRVGPHVRGHPERARWAALGMSSAVDRRILGIHQAERQTRSVDQAIALLIMI
jgi:hypothetical protein